MNEIGFDNSFIFKYSPRPGAKSAAQEDSVPQEVKEERNALLLADLKTRGRSGAAAAGRFGAGGAGGGDEPAQSGALERTHRDEPGDHFLPEPDLEAGTLRRVKNHACRKRFALRRAGVKADCARGERRPVPIVPALPGRDFFFFAVSSIA